RRKLRSVGRLIDEILKRGGPEWTGKMDPMNNLAAELPRELRHLKGVRLRASLDRLKDLERNIQGLKRSLDGAARERLKEQAKTDQKNKRLRVNLLNRLKTFLAFRPAPPEEVQARARSLFAEISDLPLEEISKRSPDYSAEIDGFSKPIYKKKPPQMNPAD